MKATEETNDCINSLIDFFLAYLFHSLFELVINIESHVMRRLITLIHESLERAISCFLKLHVILE